MTQAQAVLAYLDTEAGKVRWISRYLSGLTTEQNLGLSCIEAGIDDYDDITLICLMIGGME